MSEVGKRTLETFRAPVSVKLALLWASLMFLYIYNDYFSMWLPGYIEKMSAGQIGIPLLAASILLAIPALMIFLSVALPPTISRWLNVLLGLAYTVIEALTFLGSSLFYQIVVGLEIAVTALIVLYALRWPKQVVIE